MGKRAVGVVIALFLTGIFVGLPAFLTVFEHNTALQTYEETEGVVDESHYEVREHGDTTEFRPVVVYEYTVEGETHSAHNVYPGQFERWNESEEFVNDVADEYLEGDSVDVHYDPNDPERAYIREAGHPGAWLTAAAYAAVAAVGGFWLFRTGRRHWRRRQRKRNRITDIGSLTAGPVAIEGRALAGATEPAIAPFSREGCLVAKYEVQQYEEEDGDGGRWNTIERSGTYQPFLVDDGTGRVRVEPDGDTTFDLDPDGWTTTRVDSGERGPPPIRSFVVGHDEIDVPPDAPGEENDRRYRQNILTPGQTVTVHGTAAPLGNAAADNNADEFVVTTATDTDIAATAATNAGFEDTTMLLSEETGPDFRNRSWWRFWRAPVGGFFLLVALIFLLGIFGPIVGVPVPNLL